MKYRTILWVAMLLGLVVFGYRHFAGGRDAEAPIGVQNEAGRSGWFYIPAGSRSEGIQLLVVLHGSGGSGRDVLDIFRPLAKERHFAIVAPDSRRSPQGDFTWQPGIRAR